MSQLMKNTFVADPKRSRFPHARMYAGLWLVWLLAAAPLYALPPHVLQRRAQMQSNAAARAAATSRSAPPSSAASAAQATADDEAREIPSSQVEREVLRPSDIAMLDNPDFSWIHLQTTHFVIHCEKKIFAAKVARLGERFYTAISSDLPELHDRLTPIHSHIFIFSDPRDWQTLITQNPELTPQVASYVVGNAMYLQEYGDSTGEKMSLLAHEMTHLVMNRFLPIRLPLWLSEGLAEYYGEFAYRAAKGMGQSKSNAFRSMSVTFPLNMLFSLSSYPADPLATDLFYRTSKYVTGYLRLRQPREKWYAFFDRLLQGDDATEALLAVYEFSSIEDFEKEFLKFTK